MLQTVMWIAAIIAALVTVSVVRGICDSMTDRARWLRLCKKDSDIRRESDADKRDEQ